MLRVNRKHEKPAEPTRVIDWQYGECGRNENGTILCRVHDGAVMICTDGAVTIMLRSELQSTGTAATIDPDLHVDITISK